VFQSLPKGISVKQAAPQVVLALRTTAKDQLDIQRQIKHAMPQLADVINGPPLCRLLTFPRGGGDLQIELAFPTRSRTQRDGFATKELPGMHAFSLTHEGPLAGGEESQRFYHAWQRMVEFIVDRRILAGDDPVRCIYHRGPWTPGENETGCVTEIQVAHHLPAWLAALEEGMHRVAGEESARRVMAGSENLTTALDATETAGWVHDAIDRLDEEIEDEQARSSILNACAHHYTELTKETLLQLKAQSSNLPDLVARINEEEAVAGRYWIDETGPVPVIYIERKPARRDAHNQATSPSEKRYHACYCPLVREAIRDGKSVSRTFCHCSGGWYVQEWELLLGRTPRVDLISTLLEEAEACVFAVHLTPEDLA